MATTELPRYSVRDEAPDRAASNFSAWAVLKVILAPLASLRLTVVLLGLSLVLILAGTLAQIDYDVWRVLHEYFRVWIARIELKLFFPRSWQWHDWAAFYFPGGKLLGCALAVNLLAAHAVRFRVAARGGRLMLGTAMIVAGAAITYAVIASGANTAVESELSAEFTNRLWLALRATLGGVALALAYALALSRKRASRSQGRWLWRLGAVAAILAGALAAYLFTHPEAQLNASGLRILWQLAKATGASVVLGLGCWAVFSKRAGIVLLHSGVALLMFSELYTAERAVEAQMRIAEGETAYFAEDMRSAELALAETSDPKSDRVTVVPAAQLEEALKSGKVVDHPDLPFDIRVLKYFPNARTRLQQPGEDKTPATAGQGLLRTVDEQLESTGVAKEQAFDAPAAYIELLSKKDKSSRGVFLVSTVLSMAGGGDAFADGDSTYEVALRWKRVPKSYNLTLLDFKHELYEATNTPKNFESVVQFRDPPQHVDLTMSTSMNNPIRYAGDTIYQSGFDPENDKLTTLQIVSNSGWMVPYVACMIVLAGMLVHFVQGVVRFIYRREDEARRAAIGEDRENVAARGPIWRQWRRAAVWAPALMTLIFAAWVGSRARPPHETATEIKIREFAALPVAYGGRIQPMDSLASNTLRTISGRETYEDARYDDRQPAIRWMLDLVTRSPGFRDHRVIRVDNLDVLNALGLKRRPGFRYSISEVLGKGDEIERQVELAKGIPEGKHNLPQKKFLEINRKLQMVIALMESFSQLDLSEIKDAEKMQVLAEAVARIQALESAAPRAVPPAKPQAPWQMLLDVETRTEAAKIFPDVRNPDDDAAKSLRAILTAYRAGESQAFNSELAAYREIVEERAAAEQRYEKAQAATGESQSRKPAERLNVDRVAFEAYFNNFSPFTLCLAMYIAAFVLAAAAWLGWFEGLNRAANWLLWLTFALHTYGLVCRVYISGRPPITNLYSSALFIGWGAVAFALLFEAIYRLGVGNLLAAALGFPTTLIAYYLSLDGDGDTIGVMQAVLDTNFWLATHVVCITLGYATTFVAGAMGLVTLLMGFLGGRLDADQRRQLTRMTYGTLCFAILFSFVGTILGGLWADDSWGRFWGWDPKENGALMIVIWNAIVLHARWGKLAGERGLAALTVLGNTVVAWSWFGVNEMGVGLHAYGFTEGRAFWLAMFMISQLLVAASPYIVAAFRPVKPRALPAG